MAMHAPRSNHFFWHSTSSADLNPLTPTSSRQRSLPQQQRVLSSVMCAMAAQSCGSRLAAPRELSGAASAVRNARHWPTSSCSVPAQRHKTTS